MIEAVLAGLFGLLIGSFLNVCIYRMPRDMSVVRPRSHCPGCGRMIAAYDNIPVVSFLLLRGRCRQCASKISLRYPLVELLTGAFFFGSIWALGRTVAGVKLCVFSAIVIALIFSDLEERILPDEFTIGGAAAGIVFAAFVPVNGPWSAIFGLGGEGWLVSMADSAFAALFIAGMLWSVGWLYRKVRHRDGLGLGDVKMVAMIGAFLGLQGALLTLMAGAPLGAIVGLSYIFFAGKDAASYELPFGTFLGVAALAVAFYGEVVMNWWMRSLP